MSSTMLPFWKVSTVIQIKRELYFSLVTENCRHRREFWHVPLAYIYQDYKTWRFKENGRLGHFSQIQFLILLQLPNKLFACRECPESSKGVENSTRRQIFTRGWVAKIVQNLSDPKTLLFKEQLQQCRNKKHILKIWLIPAKNASSRTTIRLTCEGRFSRR